MKSHTVIPSLVSFPFLCQFLMILHHYCYFFLSIIPTIMVYVNLIFFTQMLLESKCMLLWWSNVSKPLCISRIVLISQFIYPQTVLQYPEKCLLSCLCVIHISFWLLFTPYWVVSLVFVYVSHPLVYYSLIESPLIYVLARILHMMSFYHSEVVAI